MEEMLSSGIAKDNEVARVSIIGVPDRPGLAFKIFTKLAAKDINVDIILQSIGRNNTKDISFTIPESQLDETMEILRTYVETIGAADAVYDGNVSKVSVVGAGMEHHPGDAAQMFEALFDEMCIRDRYYTKPVCIFSYEFSGQEQGASANCSDRNV